MSTTAKDPLARACVALEVGEKAFKPYSCPKSPHKYTQPQLFAILVLRQFFGVDHRKGRLRPGGDADYVVLDEGARCTVKADTLHNLNRYTPFEDFELTGRVRATYVRGQCAFERRPEGTEFFAPAGTGEWVRRGVV